MLRRDLLALTIVSGMVLISGGTLASLASPSFLDALPVRGIILAGSVAAIPVVASAVLLGLGVFHPLAAWVERRRAGVLPSLLRAAVPACLLAVGLHQMGTLAMGGLGPQAGILFRVILLGALAGSSLAGLAQLGRAPTPSRLLRAVRVTAALVAAGVTTAVVVRVRDASRDRPHVVLIAADGMNARSLSTYGYTRDTAPALTRLGKRSLVAENAFAHGCCTTGSTVALLTGRLPTVTKVIYPPHALADRDAYRHLPGVLTGLGYRGFQLGMPHYLDARDQNLLDGFDEVNGAALPSSGGTFAERVPRAFRTDARLLVRLWQGLPNVVAPPRRISDLRVRHPRAKTPTHEVVADARKVARAIEILNDAGPRPTLVHLHLMGTHGSRFFPATRRFSAGQEQSEAWMTDFYDDAIHEFDGHLRELVEALQQRGLFERTVIVVYSDHGWKWSAGERIPLVFRLPGRSPRRVGGNAQLVDVAPTLLDHLGREAPSWMDGRSLLPGRPVDPYRPVLSTAMVRNMRLDDGRWMLQRGSGPSFGLASAMAVVCNMRVELRLRDGEKTASTITEHTGGCDATRMPGPDEVAQMLRGHLQAQGFRVGEGP